MASLESEDFTEAQAALAFKTGKLREQNALMAQKITSMGMAIDTSVARIEQLLQHLVEWDIITVDQYLQQAHDFEMHIRPQLRDVKAKVEEQVKEMEKQQRLAALTQGVVPGGIPHGAPRSTGKRR